MSEERTEVGRRRLLVLGAAAMVVPACGGTDALPENGPFSDGGGDNPDGGGFTSSGNPFTNTGGTSQGSTGVTRTTGQTGPASSSNNSNVSSSVHGTTSGGGGSTGSTGQATSNNSSSVVHTSQSSSSHSSTSSGPPACPAGSGTYQATFAANPSLQMVGKGVVVSPPGYRDQWRNDKIYVVQHTSGSYLAYSLSCTHSGCVVESYGGSWSCPCHSATFSATGAVTGGPARTNLQSYAVCADSVGVTITLS